MLISRTDSRCSFKEAVLDKVNMEIPVKLSINPHIIEIMLAQSLVFRPWYIRPFKLFETH